MLKLLSKDCKSAVDTFFIIGVMPHGLFKQDLDIILQSDQSDSLTKLINSSLIEKDTTTGLYRVSPFIDHFVDMKISS
jgi:hypothetical protein